MLAELVMDGATSTPIDAFSISRFANRPPAIDNAEYLPRLQLFVRLSVQWPMQRNGDFF